MVNAILEAFPDAHIHSGYARVRCPYHKDGNEQHASMSVLLEPRGKLQAGMCHCFACGKVVTIQELMEYIGKPIKTDLASLRVTAEKVNPLITTPPVFKPSVPYRYSPYLASRGIKEATQRRFCIFEKDGMVHMPVFDRQGKYLYDNARSTRGKFFSVEEYASKSLWGIEEIDLSKPIVVCESQIDALSCWEAGMQAVATLGADNTRALNDIRKASSIIVLGFDPDEAGIKARDKAVALLGKYRCRWLDLPSGVDVNQALQDIGDVAKFSKFLQSRVRTFS